MTSETEGKRVFITVDRHELGGLQLSINVEDKDGSGHGYRIAGSKYSGGSATLLKHVIDEQDISEIRQYLDEAAREERITDAGSKTHPASIASERQ